MFSFNVTEFFCFVYLREFGNLTKIKNKEGKRVKENKKTIKFLN